VKVLRANMVNVIKTYGEREVKDPLTDNLALNARVVSPTPRPLLHPLATRLGGPNGRPATVSYTVLTARPQIVTLE
jgi:hypothetical protein